MYKLDFEKTEGTETKLPMPLDPRKHKEKKKKKTSTTVLLTMLKPLTMWITINCRKFLDVNTDYLTCLLRCLYEGQEASVRTGHGTMVQSTSCEMLGWMTHMLKSRLPREIQATSDMQMTPP